MEFRKLVSFGKGSYVMSIPKDWVTKNNLKKGDLIGVEETALGLNLSASGSETKKEKKTATISTDEKEIKQITTEIISAYLNNADVIEVLSKNLQDQALDIKNIFFNLSGMEIMEQTSTKMVANYLIDKNEISIPLMIRRMDNITRAMLQDAIETLEKKQSVENIVQRDQDVNRLHFLISREIRAAIINPQTAKSINMSNMDLHISKHVSLRIERFADCQKEIAYNLTKINLSKESIKGLKDIFNDIKEMYYDVMKAYYSQDKGLAHSVERSSKDITNTLDNFLVNHVHGTPDPKVKDSHIATARIIHQLHVMGSMIKYIARHVIDCQ